MPSTVGPGPTVEPAGFETDARRLAVKLEKGKYLVLAFFTLWYALGAVRHAHNKPLWFDEIITVICATPPTASAALQASHDMDASPPLPHLLTHFSMQWFGPSEVAIRLPAIVGFWIFSLCLFVFTRRLGIFYALVAMLLPIATEAYTYAYEARAYGLELAFAGLALVSWQAATENRRRWLTCAGLAIALIAAIFCHYYAVLLYIPLAGAEAFRTLRTRKIGWPIWLAFAIGVAPLVWQLTRLRAVVRGFNHGTWSPAYPEQVVEFWENGLQHSLSFLVLGLVFMAIWMIRRRPSADTVHNAPPALAPHELIAAILFLAIPVAAVGIGLVVTHMFVPRYALFAITGAVLLAAAMAAQVSGGRALPGFLLLCLSTLPLAFVTVEVPARHNPFADEQLLADALRQGPVVVADGQTFLQMWQYAPVELRPNILFLADNAAAMKYMGFDAIDGGLRVLRPWSSVQVLEYADFATPGRQFLLYQNSLKSTWLLPRILADGGTAEVQSSTPYRELFRIRLK